MPITELMQTDPMPAGQPTACPSCGAAVRADVPWCTLCYSALRPSSPPDAVPRPDAVPEQIPDAEGGAAPERIDTLAERLLAELAAQPDPTGRWATMLPPSPAARAAVITGGAVAACLLLLAVMFVVGVLL